MRKMVEQGSYEVDPRLVADAILARTHGWAIVPNRVVALQKECSNPESRSLASANTASG
jgi:hypothetical protein